MDKKNTFLDSYKKKVDKGKAESTGSAAAHEKQPGLSSEGKTGFNQPVKKDSGGLVNLKNPAINKKTAAVIIGSIILVLVIVGLVFILNRGIEMIDLTDWTENDADGPEIMVYCCKLNRNTMMNMKQAE